MSVLVNRRLSVFLCFASFLLYPSYALVARPFGLDALQDQIAAGVFMRVFSFLVFLARAVYLTTRFLTNGRLIDEKTGLERTRAMAQ
jgi:putative membrane protein